MVVFLRGGVWNRSGAGWGFLTHRWLYKQIHLLTSGLELSNSRVVLPPTVRLCPLLPLLDLLQATLSASSRPNPHSCLPRLSQTHGQ